MRRASRASPDRRARGRRPRRRSTGLCREYERTLGAPFWPVAEASDGACITASTAVGWLRGPRRRPMGGRLLLAAHGWATRTAPPPGEHHVSPAARPPED